MNATVLVVDDFASVRLYHMSFLSRKGYACLGASSGAEAMALLRAQPVNLILLDLMMPGMDGRQFIEELNQIPNLATVPVLVITSEGERAKASLFRPTATVSVLAKPVMPDALLHAVQDLLGTPARRREREPG